MAGITLQDLLEAGVHFGHQSRRWNPKMKKFIFTERNGIYIIDLQKTLKLVNKACDAIREIAARGEPILFVGTKSQASSIMKEEAERCEQFFVTNRWAGGMLTNYRTIRQSIKRLNNLEKMAADGTYELLTKKEVLNIEKQRAKLSYMLDGIIDLKRLPGLLVVVDTKKEKIAVNEAVRLGIPICAIIDTNCDPDPITFPIPGNDDAIRSIKILLSTITDAIMEGMQIHADKAGIAEKEKALRKAEELEEEQKKRSHNAQRRKEIKDRTSGGEKTRSGAGENKEKASKPDEKPEAIPTTGENEKSDSVDKGTSKAGEKDKAAVETSDKDKKAPTTQKKKSGEPKKDVKKAEEKKGGKTTTKTTTEKTTTDKEASDKTAEEAKPEGKTKPETAKK